MKRRLCARSSGEVSALELGEVNDSLAEMAIRKQRNGGGCKCGGRRCQVSINRFKRRHFRTRAFQVTFPFGINGDPDKDNILSELSQLSDCYFSGSDTSASSTSDRRIPTVFRWSGDAKNVFLTGSFDNWKTKIPLVRSQTGFMTVVDIPEGTHQYKYMVDGEWKCLLNEPQVEAECGSSNNIVTVKSSDWDVFEALNVDSGIDATARAEDNWTQYIPPRDRGYNYLRAGPPLLPPHLVCSVLNQPTPSHVDPTVLAEPNHVLLNHLYTLSIKDGVLVLSATHRYRRKYITTLLYKPIN